MAITQLGQGTSNDGAGNSVAWNISYDSTAHTVGLTVTGTGTTTILVISVTLTALGLTLPLDCVHGAAGNMVNAGRKILAGAGSVLGFTNPVVGIPLPPFARGSVPPYIFDFSWHQ